MTAYAAWTVIPMLASWVCGFCYGVALGSGKPRAARGLALLAAAAYAILSLPAALSQGWQPATALLGYAVFWLWLWYRLRRRRKRRSLKALGHKARARLAAMLRSMPKPGPVLRPVPQAARA